MLYSGEEIRQAASAWSEDSEVPETMRNSGYYGFREGCKLMQHMYWDYLMENPIIKRELMKDLNP